MPKYETPFDEWLCESVAASMFDQGPDSLEEFTGVADEGNIMDYCVQPAIEWGESRGLSVFNGDTVSPQSPLFKSSPSAADIRLMGEVAAENFIEWRANQP